MKGRKPVIQYFIRLAVVVFVIGGIITVPENINIPFLLICMLVFILSSQIRLVFLQGRVFIASVFIELALGYYIYTQFNGVSQLLLFIAMMDSVLLLDVEGWFISAVTACMLAYLLRNRDAEIIILSFAVLIFFLITGLQLRKLKNEADDMETLYDDNRKYSYQLEDAKERLEEYSKKVEQLTQSDERSRISGELHDTIGHKLTGVLMQLEAAIRVVNADAEGGREMLGSVRENLSSCIDLLRLTVRNIKPVEKNNRILSIQQTINDFSRNTGVNIEFNITGIPFKLYPSAEITLLKNVQEALTNAVRHGKAKNITVDLIYSEEDITLTVRDDGCGCTDVAKGMGLAGMEERAGLLRGRIIISSEKGFEIKTVIPVKIN